MKVDLVGHRFTMTVKVFEIKKDMLATKELSIIVKNVEAIMDISLKMDQTQPAKDIVTMVLV